MLRSFRLAFRSLRRSPGFTTVAVLSLALGIGVTTALFTLADAILFRAFPGREPDRLVAVYSRSAKGEWAPVSYPDYAEFRDQTEVFAGLMAYDRTPFSFDAGARTQLLWGELISANYFDVLGLRMALGRGFRPGEDHPGAPHPVVVISYSLWQRSFGSDPAVAGRPVRIYGRNFTIVGVAPNGFRGVTLDWGDPPDLWMPIGWFDEFEWFVPKRRALDWREARIALVVGRLRPGVTIETARAALRVRAAQLAAAHPENRNWTVEVLPGREARFWPAYRRGVISFLALIGATVGFVLLVACANVASLQLARGAAREREIAVRLALGASRRRIVGELLLESAVISGLGFSGGLAVAHGGIILIRRFPLPFEVPVHVALGLDPRVLLFAMAVSVFATLLAGLFPALATARADLRSSLQAQAGGSGTSFRHSRLRSGLVAAEVALASLLLVGAGLFLRTLGRAASVDLGIRVDNVLALSVDFDSTGSRSDEIKVAQFCRRSLDRIRAVPGVLDAAWSGDDPLTRRRLLLWFVKDGTPVSGDTDWNRIDCNVTSPGHFKTLGIGLVRGREFTERDDDTAPIGTAIVNEAMARRYWPGEDPIGKRIRLRGKTRELYEIVGIARDVRQRSVWNDPEPYLYVPLYQRYFRAPILHVHVAAQPEPVLSAVERELAAVDAGLPVAGAKSLRAKLDELLATERTAAALFGASGALALVLAAAGVYGVLAYAVTRRTREIGIRMALGADRRAVQGLVLRQGMALAGLGIAAGSAVALALTRFVASYLHGVSPTDPVTFALVAAVLAGAAAAACLIPSRRAARIDPAVALRHE